MVRPASFSFNSETAQTNVFQRSPSAAEAAEAQRLAGHEFDALSRALQRAGVEVIVASDTPTPSKPDALYPNNWVSFHADGTVVLYPLLSANRRPERREEVIRQVAREGSFRIARTIDLSYREAQGKYLEGTGSLVLDRAHRVAYANLSPRTHLDVLGEFAQQLDYTLMTFEAFDHADVAIYHTNVMLAIGAKFAVICAAAITQIAQRAAVVSSLRDTGRDLIDISLDQMQNFAGNLLELGSVGGPVIALSAAAWASFSMEQRRVLEAVGRVVPVAIPVIERLGGGSVRCMLAEIFLPKRE